MSEQKTGRERRSPLRTGRGDTIIQDTVVSKMVGIVAEEVDGVHKGGSASRALGGVTGAPGDLTRGVTVEVGEVEAAVDITLSVDYGVSIPRVADAVRGNVIDRIENPLGLSVTEVNVTVADVVLPDGEGQQRRDAAS